jgi:hypothetical protein
MSRRTLFLIFALFIITVVLLMMAIYQPKAVNITAQITPTPNSPIAQTVLSVGIPSLVTSPAASSSPILQPGVLNYSLPIEISTGQNKATAIQLELQFDPLLLTNVEITPGPFFTKPTIFLNQIDNKTGRISYAFGVATAGVRGKGIAANLFFSVRSKVPEKTAIIFLPKTLVTAEGVSESVLTKDTLVGNFTVGIINSTSSAAPNQ